MVYDHDKETLIKDLIAERDAAVAAHAAICARQEQDIRHLPKRLADALRVLASIADQIRCDSPIQSQHCDECAEQLSDADLLSESLRCEDCEATHRIEIAADESESRKVDAAVERDQAQRHGEVIE